MLFYMTNMCLEKTMQKTVFVCLRRRSQPYFVGQVEQPKLQDVANKTLASTLGNNEIY